MMTLQNLIELDWLLVVWNFIYSSAIDLIKDFSKVKYNYNSDFSC